MNKVCKTCKRFVAGTNGHCAECSKKLSPEAKQDIENRSKKKRGYILEKTLDGW